MATFYSMYRRTPTGEYLVGVCTNTLCAIMGGDAILEALQDHLGIHAGETTDDGRVTLDHVECNAACDYAPVVMVNWEFFDNQTLSSARDLVDGLRAGQPPVPTRGALRTCETATHPGRPARRAATPRARSGPPPWQGCGSPRNGHGTGAPRCGPSRRYDGGGHRTGGRRVHEGRTRTGTVGHRAAQAGNYRNRPEHNGFGP